MTGNRTTTRALGLICAALLLAMLALAGCGDDDDSAEKNTKQQITVSAAASLADAFEDIGDEFDAASVKFQFAGSDALAAQIKNGVRPEVFAAANTKLPDQLFKEGLVEKPVPFATNSLVIAVPKDQTNIDSIDDLAAKDVAVAAGAESVPVGSYTRKTLAKLPAADEKAILANIKSSEPDVKGVVGKVVNGAVDAGFVYITDVEATDGKLRAITLPPSLQPDVVYAAALVKGAKQPELGQQFLDFLLSPEAQEELTDEGFGAAPK